MADIKHQHNDSDIIIKDQDGTYKILRDGKFVPLDQGEATAHGLSNEGPKRAPDAVKPAPQPVRPAAPQPIAPQQPVSAAKPIPVAPKSSKPMPSAGGEVRGFADQDLQKKAEEMVGKSGVTFASGEIRGRVVKALIAHIKGIRKPFETKGNLVKPVQEGGAGLSESEASRILSAAGAPTSSVATPSGVSPITRPENPVAKPVHQPVGKEISAPARVAFNQLAAGADAPYFPLNNAAKPMTKPLQPVVSARPAVSDIARPARAIGGPVDELAYDLSTWRRLAPNPLDRVKKIETHLDLLEQDGFGERLKGVAAWRNSQVVSLYLSSGKKSLEENHPLAALLAEGGPDRLSVQEWQAVNTLNSRLLG